MRASLLIIFFGFAASFSPNLSAQSIQQLRIAFEKAPNDTIKLNTAKQLFGRYVYSKVDSAIFYAEQVMALGETLANPKHKSTGVQYLGIAYTIKGDFEQAANYMQQNLDYYTRIGDSLNMAYTLNNLGVNFLYAEDWLLSSQNFLQSVRIKEDLVARGAIGSKEADLASTLLNVAITYDNQSDTSQAAKYFTLALNEARMVKDSLNAAKAQNGLGNLALTRKNYEQALLYFKSIEPVFAGQNDLFSLGKLYNNMALCYAELNNTNELMTYAKRATEVNKEIGNEQSEGLALMYLGLGYLKMNRFGEAIETSAKALSIGQRLNTKALMAGSYKNLYEAYAAVGNYTKAYEYSLLFQQTDKDLYSLERAEQIEKLSAQYEAEKREAQILQLNQEKALQTLALEKANSERNLLLALLASALILAALIIYFYRKIALSKKQLNQKNAELERLNKTKDRFFAIISHDLRSHISAFQSSGRLMKHYMAGKDTHKLETLGKELDKSAHNIGHLLDNLLQWSIDQLHGYEPKPQPLSLKAVALELIQIYEPQALAKGLSIHSTIDDNHKVMADRGSLFVVMRNLLANAIKFTEQGRVQLFSSIEENWVVLGVQDSGIGIPALMQAELFSINEQKIRRGTQNEKGTGLGLHLVHEFVRMNGGKVAVRSEPYEGSTFLVYLKHA
ncbi:MAG: tetratricopeptide repeat-containing sensor histidine kinase [Bacteroidota bacterium]|nr:tetratricopeptide repeat-containing sensor histidine kinase [Bacteroidota bacterium]